MCPAQELTVHDNQTRVVLERVVAQLEAQAQDLKAQLSAARGKLAFLEPETTMLRGKVCVCVVCVWGGGRSRCHVTQQLPV